MSDLIPRSVSFLKATAIGGLVFLLPFAAIIFVLSYVFQAAQQVYKAVDPLLPDFFHSNVGIAILFLGGVAAVIIACFASGLVASRSIAKEGNRWIENNLVKVFPKYAIYKDLLAGTLGGDHHKVTMKPAYVNYQGVSRLVFETNRYEDGMVAVYFPGSPDPWNGFLARVPADQVTLAELSFFDAVGQLEQMGRSVSPAALVLPRD
ncbi:MAG: DUF502 domain-containing protein [Pirellula sp.]|jgi:uncharacterized membrane protein|nr:DUF502 domain-containing protein [Pirellula sp.]